MQVILLLISRMKFTRNTGSRLPIWKLVPTLIPYVSPEEFERITKENVLDHSDIESQFFPANLMFSGKYGKT